MWTCHQMCCFLLLVIISLFHSPASTIIVIIRIHILIHLFKNVFRQVDLTRPCEFLDRKKFLVATWQAHIARRCGPFTTISTGVVPETSIFTRPLVVAISKPGQHAATWCIGSRTAASTSGYYHTRGGHTKRIVPDVTLKCFQQLTLVYGFAPVESRLRK